MVIQAPRHLEFWWDCPKEIIFAALSTTASLGQRMVRAPSRSKVNSKSYKTKKKIETTYNLIESQLTEQLLTIMGSLEKHVGYIQLDAS